MNQHTSDERIHRQRLQITALKARLRLYVRQDVQAVLLANQVRIVEAQAGKLMAENIRLRQRNHELEALHSVVTTSQS